MTNSTGASATKKSFRLALLASAMGLAVPTAAAAQDQAEPEKKTKVKA